MSGDGGDGGWGGGDQTGSGFGYGGYGQDPGTSGGYYGGDSSGSPTGTDPSSYGSSNSSDWGGGGGSDFGGGGSAGGGDFGSGGGDFGSVSSNPSNIGGGFNQGDVGGGWGNAAAAWGGGGGDFGSVSSNPGNIGAGWNQGNAYGGYQPSRSDQWGGGGGNYDVGGGTSDGYNTGSWAIGGDFGQVSSNPENIGTGFLQGGGGGGYDPSTGLSSAGGDFGFGSVSSNPTNLDQAGFTQGMPTSGLQGLTPLSPGDQKNFDFQGPTQTGGFTRAAIDMSMSPQAMLSGDLSSAGISPDFAGLIMDPSELNSLASTIRNLPGVAANELGYAPRSTLAQDVSGAPSFYNPAKTEFVTPSDPGAGTFAPEAANVNVPGPYDLGPAAGTIFGTNALVGAEMPSVTAAMQAQMTPGDFLGVPNDLNLTNMPAPAGETQYAPTIGPADVVSQRYASTYPSYGPPAETPQGNYDRQLQNFESAVPGAQQSINATLGGDIAGGALDLAAGVAGSLAPSAPNDFAQSGLEGSARWAVSPDVTGLRTAATDVGNIARLMAAPVTAPIAGAFNLANAMMAEPAYGSGAPTPSYAVTPQAPADMQGTGTGISSVIQLMKDNPGLTQQQLEQKIRDAFPAGQYPADKPLRMPSPVGGPSPDYGPASTLTASDISAQPQYAQDTTTAQINPTSFPDQLASVGPTTVASLLGPSTLRDYTPSGIPEGTGMVADQSGTGNRFTISGNQESPNATGNQVATSIAAPASAWGGPQSDAMGSYGFGNLAPAATGPVDVNRTAMELGNVPAAEGGPLGIDRSQIATPAWTGEGDPLGVSRWGSYDVGSGATPSVATQNLPDVSAPQAVTDFSPTAPNVQPGPIGIGPWGAVPPGLQSNYPDPRVNPNVATMAGPTTPTAFPQDFGQVTGQAPGAVISALQQSAANPGANWNPGNYVQQDEPGSITPSATPGAVNVGMTPSSVPGSIINTQFSANVATPAANFQNNPTADNLGPVISSIQNLANQTAANVPQLASSAAELSAIQERMASLAASDLSPSVKQELQQQLQDEAKTEIIAAGPASVEAVNNLRATPATPTPASTGAQDNGTVTTPPSTPQPPAGTTTPAPPVSGPEPQVSSGPASDTTGTAPGPAPSTGVTGTVTQPGSAISASPIYVAGNVPPEIRGGGTALSSSQPYYADVTSPANQGGRGGQIQTASGGLGDIGGTTTPPATGDLGYPFPIWGVNWGVGPANYGHPAPTATGWSGQVMNPQWINDLYNWVQQGGAGGSVFRPSGA